MNYLSQNLQIILVISAAVYTFVVGYFSTFTLFTDLSKYNSQNIDSAIPFNNIIQDLIAVPHQSSVEGVFILLSYFLTVIPIIFTIVILIAGIKLLKAMVSHHLEFEEILAAKHLGQISKITVYITVICNLALNVLQFLFSNQLLNTNYTLQISFVPLIIAFAAYILAGYFKETKDLHEDNSMII